MPYANMNIGAPMCTFAYGGVPLDEVSAYYDLIKGPATTDTTYDNQKYEPEYDSEATVSDAVSGDYDDLPPETTTQVFGIPNPTIPASSRTIFD